MSSAPALRRTERFPESIEFESSATWGQVSPRVVPGPSGSVEFQHPDPLIRIRRPRPSPVFFEEPDIEEATSGIAFAIGPASGWTQPSLQAALLGVFGQLQCGTPQTWPQAGAQSFWPQATGAHVRFSLQQGAAPLQIGSFHGVRANHAWQPAGRTHVPFDFMLVAREEPSVSDEALFRALAALWRRDTFNISSTSRMAMHPAYQRVIGMGSVAVPLILRELQGRPDWWFWALQAITGVDPVPPSWRGSLREMAAAWLAWGQEHGYLTR